MQLNPIFPNFIDSSMLADIKACELKAALRYIYGLSPPTTSAHLVVGHTLAKGLEQTRRAFFTKGMSEEDSLRYGAQAALKSWPEDIPIDNGGDKKSLVRVIDALEVYFKQYPLSSDPYRPLGWEKQDPAVEYTFSIPIPIYHPTTGDLLTFVGRFDMLAERSDMIFVLDDKTCSQLGATWPQKWPLRGQFIGYVWGARKGAIPAMGYIARGICFYKYHTECLEATGLFNERVIENWYTSMIKTVERFIRCFKENYFAQAFDDACTAYSGCPFADSCMAHDPMPWLGQFTERRWDPLENEEESI